MVTWLAFFTFKTQTSLRHESKWKYINAHKESIGCPSSVSKKKLNQWLTVLYADIIQRISLVMDKKQKVGKKLVNARKYITAFVVPLFVKLAVVKLH